MSDIENQAAPKFIQNIRLTHYLLLGVYALYMICTTIYYFMFQNNNHGSITSNYSTDFISISFYIITLLLYYLRRRIGWILLMAYSVYFCIKYVTTLIEFFNAYWMSNTYERYVLITPNVKYGYELMIITFVFEATLFSCTSFFLSIGSIRKLYHVNIWLMLITIIIAITAYLL